MQQVFLQKHWFVGIMLLCLSLTSVAQNYTSSDNQAIKLYDKGVDALKRRSFDEAQELFQKAIDRDDRFAEAHYRLAYDIYRIFKMDTEMFYHYTKVIEAAPTNRRFVEVYPAILQREIKNCDYPKLEALANQYLSLDPQDPSGLRLAQKILVDCKFAQAGIKNPLNFNPEALPAPLNQFYLQYFPALSADQQMLIFTARKPPNNMNPEPDENMYVSYWQNGSWSVPQPIQEINSPDNEGTCSISADGRVLVFTACHGNGIVNYGRCDLYITYRNGDTWSAPENLGTAINSEAWESQPSLTADGRTLYFVSTRSGGLGKRDIWSSRKDENDQWMPAVNLGPNINTDSDELSPFIHVNGRTLFFSSNGYPGFGGYDLYSAEMINRQWTLPKNLGYPINTCEDQVGLFITTDGRKGYYSVEKTEGGKYLSSILQVFDLPEEVKPVVKSNYVKGYVYDAKTQEKLSAKIDLFDLKISSLETSVNSDTENGNYLIVLNQGSEYALQVLKQGYAFKSLSFNYTEEKDLEPLEINIALEPITAGTIFRLNNIFFAALSYDLEDKSRTELDELVKFMSQNPEVKGEISGHTDDRGSDEYNMDLSLNRAKSVYNYLIQAGVDPARIKYQGYGKNQPAAPNDSEENRALNRRIEFKIL